MPGPKMVASIDVGTTKVCSVLARLEWYGELEVLGVSTIPSEGLWKGEVVDVEEASRSIRKSVEELHETCGIPLTSAYVGITGSHVSCVNNRGLVGSSRNFRYFSSGPVNRTLEEARYSSMTPDTEVLHVIPRAYHLDGHRRPGSPYGVRGHNLEMETHVITGAVNRIKLLVESVQNAGVQVKGLVLEPLASSQAVLTREEQEVGVILADIGGGSTDVAAFIEGTIWDTSVIPVGGNHVTGDLAAWLDTEPQQAERTKIKHGHAMPEQVDPEERVPLSGTSESDAEPVYRRELCEVIRDRMEETLQLIGQRVRAAGMKEGPAGGIVLTGGTSNLPGIETLAKRVLDMPVRVGRPTLLEGAPASLRDPAFATSMGIIIWKLVHEDGESKLDRLGFTNYFNNFSKRMLSRVEAPVNGHFPAHFEPEAQV